MGSKTSSQQDQSSGTFADPQAAQDYTQAIRRAKQVSNTPYQAYSGELTAGVNSQENLATSAMNGLGATASGYYGQAANQSGLGAAAVNPTAVNGAAIAQYESPYQQDVINATMAQINQQNKIQQNQQTSNAIGAGAFGGDRAGLASAALAGQQALATNSTLAGLNNQNYAQALGEANTQQAVGLGAAQANRTALQQNAETLAGIGSAATNSGLGIANAQLGAGALQQQTQQASDTAQYGQFEQKQAYPFQTEQYLANIIGALAPNYGSSSYGTTTTQTSPLNSIIGGGLAAGALLSDRRAKEDIKKIGKTFDGQIIYQFRYKGDDTTHVGLMADEVEKKHPGAVGSLGDLKTVDYAEATRKAANKGHFAAGGSIGATPFSDVDGYVPVAGAASSARMLQASPLQSAQPANTNSAIPNFSQFTAAGAGLSNAVGSLGNAARSIGNYFGGGMNSVGMFNFAEGGKVVGLAGARARRGYDGGGVVAPDALMFDPNVIDPNSLGSLGQFQPGVGVAPQRVMTPPPPIPTPSGGVAPPAAAPAPAPASNDNKPVPVAPAPVMTPVLGYQGQSGGLAAAGDSAAAPSTGLGAISAATAPRSVRNHNPGNIEDGPFARKMPGYVGGDGRFAVFDTPENGAGAQDALLTSYGKQGLVTPLQIVSKWAPAGDGSNDPKAYAGSVAKQLGIGIDTPIDMTDPGQRAALGRAMAQVEAGGPRSAGTPSRALGYAPSGGAGLGQAAALGNVSDLSSGVAPSKLSDYFGSIVGGTGTPSAGHSGGVLGLFPGVSDDARMAVAAAGLGMAASPSKSFGVALGQGGLEGIKSYQAQQKLTNERALAQGTLANQKSEIATRQGELALGNRRVDVSSSQFQDTLENLRKELALKSQEVANQTARTKSEVGLQGAETVNKLRVPTPQGMLVSDPANPSAPPKLVPYSAITPNAGAPAAPGAPTPTPAPASPVVDPSGYVHPPAQLQMNPSLISPQGQAVAAENNKAVMDRSRAGAEAAQDQVMTLDRMQHAAAGLPTTGWLAAGSGQGERVAAAKAINATLGTLGIDPSHMPNADQIASSEELKKLTFQMGADLSKSVGGREPGFIVEKAVGSVPSSENSAMGFQRLTAGLRAVAQRNIDMHNWNTEWFQRNSDLAGAEDAFNKANPQERYAAQAVLSTVPPNAIAYLRQHPEARGQFDAKFGAGTSKYAMGTP